MTGHRKIRGTFRYPERPDLKSSRYAPSRRNDALLHLHLLPCEDEEVVAYLLRERPDMELMEMQGYEGFSQAARICRYSR